MTIDDYFQSIDSFLAGIAIAYARQVDFDKRSPDTGFLRGQVYFLDGSVLHFREFIAAEQEIERYKYAYHYQSPDGSLIFRYDRTPHFPLLDNFPHHKHIGEGQNVIPADGPDLFEVLEEIRQILIAKG
ncbi:MAG: hypothetical protein KF753_02535 [Caldilineaceae bacterium]|nr:hypothetical protein [Caldilineaceae bacterium]